MRFGALRILLFCIGLCCYSLSAYAQDSLRQRQEAAKADRQALQKQIQQLQNKISVDERQRNDIATSLKNSEEKISEISKILHEYELRNKDLADSLDKLDRSKLEQQDLLAKQQAALAKQLKAQYSSGLSSWTALLSGKDPQDINRDLSYLGYVLRARVTALEKINQTSQRLDDLSQQIANSQAELQDLQKKSAQERDNLKQQQVKHAAELAKIKEQLSNKENQAKKLVNRDKLLADLIQDLDKEIAQAAKAAQERKLARQKELEQQQAAAKKAAEKAAEQKAAEQKVAQQQSQTRASKAKSIEFEPEDGFPGLQKGLDAPVRGEVLGRFGAQRPEGGVWRGIVLRTAEDTNVHSVADGKVVYSSWLSGFGNLLIVDHGRGYLSIYGYNKANMKAVGDLVGAGEIIAKVGATGGQVEPGLYFELRQDGAPINPQLWLKP